MNGHSTAPASFMTTSSHRSSEPHHNFMSPTNSEQNNFELVGPIQSGLYAPLSPPSQRLPSINSIFQTEITRKAPIQQAAPQQDFSTQMMPLSFPDHSKSRIWGRQPVWSGNYFAQAYVGNSRIQLLNGVPLLGRFFSDAQVDPCLHSAYSPLFEMSNWHGRTESFQMIPYPNSTIEKPGSIQADILRCGHVDHLTKQLCTSIFSRRDCLLRHKRTVHNSSKSKWECQLCAENRKFTRYDSLARHMRQINGVLDFPGKQRSSTYSD